MTNMNNVSTTKVFYDGACPLCSREINNYKKLSEKDGNTNDIDWVDISRQHDELAVEGINYNEAMRLIHIKDETGVHQVGIDGFLTLWDKLPYYRKLAQALRCIPGHRLVLSKIYSFLAKHRMTFSQLFVRK